MIGNKMIKCRFLNLRFCLGYDMGKGNIFLVDIEFLKGVS